VDGRYSAAFILLFVVSGVLTGLGGVGPGPVGSILGVAFGTSGITALANGLVSTIKRKEQSILVFLAVNIRCFLLDSHLGEFLVPH